MYICSVNKMHPFKSVIKKVYYENHKNCYFINYSVFYLL